MDNPHNNEVHKLEYSWTLWYHDPDDKNWDINSYKKLIKFSTLEEFLKYYDLIKTFIYGMFFLMKEDILPIWEDKNNINGGIMTYKILKETSDQSFIDLSMLLVGGTLTDEYKYINGISLSPKINNCIIKIWINNAKIMSKIKLNTEISLLKDNNSIHKIFT